METIVKLSLVRVFSRFAILFLSLVLSAQAVSAPKDYDVRDKNSAVAPNNVVRRPDHSLERMHFADGRYLLFGLRRLNGSYESILIAQGVRVIGDLTFSGSNQIDVQGKQKRYNELGDWEEDEYEIYNWYIELIEWEWGSCWASGGCPSPRAACIEGCHRSTRALESVCRGMPHAAAAALCWAALYYDLQQCISNCE